MAKAKNKTSKKRTKKVSLAVVIGAMPLVTNSWNGYKAFGLEGLADAASGAMTGYSPMSGSWAAFRLMRGLVPLLIGGFATKMAGKLGVNRAISSIPFVKI